MINLGSVSAEYCFLLPLTKFVVQVLGFSKPNREIGQAEEGIVMETIGKHRQRSTLNPLYSTRDPSQPDEPDVERKRKSTHFRVQERCKDPGPETQNTTRSPNPKPQALHPNPKP